MHLQKCLTFGVHINMTAAFYFLIFDHDRTETSDRWLFEPILLPGFAERAEQREPKIPRQSQCVIMQMLRKQPAISIGEIHRHAVPVGNYARKMLLGELAEAFIFGFSECRDGRDQLLAVLFDVSFGYAGCEIVLVLGATGQNKILADVYFEVVYHPSIGK